MTEFAFIDELSGDSFEEDTSSKKTFPLMPEGEAFDMGTDESGKPLSTPGYSTALNFFETLILTIESCAITIQYFTTNFTTRFG